MILKYSMSSAASSKIVLGNILMFTFQACLKCTECNRSPDNDTPMMLGRSKYLSNFQVFSRQFNLINFQTLQPNIFLLLLNPFCYAHWLAFIKFERKPSKYVP